MAVAQELVGVRTWSLFILGQVRSQMNVGKELYMKNRSSSATALPGSAALPFVISTEAQWRDLCVDTLS